MPLTRAGIDKGLRGVFHAMPLYMGLCKGSPGENGAAVADSECDGPGYSRQLVIFGEPYDFPDGEGRQIANTNIVTFPLADAQAVVRWFVSDEPTGVMGDQALVTGEVLAASDRAEGRVAGFEPGTIRIALIL